MIIKQIDSKNDVCDLCNSNIKVGKWCAVLLIHTQYLICLECLVTAVNDIIIIQGS